MSSTDLNSRNQQDMSHSRPARMMRPGTVTLQHITNRPSPSSYIYFYIYWMLFESMSPAWCLHPHPCGHSDELLLCSQAVFKLSERLPDVFAPSTCNGSYRSIGQENGSNSASQERSPRHYMPSVTAGSPSQQWGLEGVTRPTPVRLQGPIPRTQAPRLDTTVNSKEGERERRCPQLMFLNDLPKPTSP